jgi:hypothetical protein
VTKEAPMSSCGASFLIDARRGNPKLNQLLSRGHTVINSRATALLDHERLMLQLVSLERTSVRFGSAF